MAEAMWATSADVSNFFWKPKIIVMPFLVTKMVNPPLIRKQKLYPHLQLNSHGECSVVGHACAEERQHPMEEAMWATSAELKKTIVMTFLVTKVYDRWNSGKCKLETAKSKQSTSLWTLLLLIRRRPSCMCLFVNTQDCVVFYVIEKSQASSPKKDSINKKRSLHLSGIICSSRTACVDFHAMNVVRRKAELK